MELYERVILASKRLTGTNYGMCEFIEVNEHTFRGYLKLARQNNLWEHLPKILEAFPRLSRQWLYFGEGPMLIGHGVPLDKPVPLRMIAEAVDEMAKDAGGEEAEVLRYIAGISIPEDEEKNDFKLKEENILLKEKIIALQEEIIELHKEKDKKIANNVIGIGSAAPL